MSKSHVHSILLGAVVILCLSAAVLPGVHSQKTSRNSSVVSIPTKPQLSSDDPEELGTATITGTITDQYSAEPLIGASVWIEGTQLGAGTDVDGRYQISGAPEGSQTLFVQLVGYEKKRLTILLKANDTLQLDVQLAVNNSMINEVVIQEYSAPGTKAIRGKMHKENAPSMSFSADAEDYSNYAGQVAAPITPILQKSRKNSTQQDSLDYNTEEYDRIMDNPFKAVLGNPVSTFSIDVDAASYANIRRYLDYDQQPPKDAVRIEELVNYFTYDYAKPQNEDPFAVITEISETPWNPESRLIHIGLQGKDIDRENLAPSNLVFLIDVSGSMQAANKLGLVKSSLMKLVDQLGTQDRVAIVVYAGAAGAVLPSTSASDKKAINDALLRLKAGGSTAGGAGINLAYDIAQKNLIQNGNNRVILCTDGDFNIGASSDAEMVRLIEEKRKSGIYITVCGFGMGNYKDSKMEKIADAGNGNYFYIDREKEADKVFIAEMRGTLFTIAKDVKLQIEFNPAVVKSYRLIGYENRLLAREDFDDDTKDAGELGAGHTVTALYEVVLNDKKTVDSKGDQQKQGREQVVLPIDDLRYQQTSVKPQAYTSDEILTLKLRYKNPGEEQSKLIIHPLKDTRIPLAASSNNFRWSAAVAAYGMVLRDSPYKGTANLDLVLKLARGSKGPDLEGYRDDFIKMVSQTQNLASAK